MRRPSPVAMLFLFLLASVSSSYAQALSEPASGEHETIVLPGEKPADADWDIADALPLTCLQLWEAYGENDQDVVEIIPTMAGMSIVNRELDFPQTEEAGRSLGEGILKSCAQDRNDLMYAIVDRNVRKVVAEHPNR